MMKRAIHEECPASCLKKLGNICFLSDDGWIGRMNVSESGFIQ